MRHSPARDAARLLRPTGDDSAQVSATQIEHASTFFNRLIGSSSLKRCCRANDCRIAIACAFVHSFVAPTLKCPACAAGRGGLCGKRVRHSSRNAQHPETSPGAKHEMGKRNVLALTESLIAGRAG